MALAEGIFAAVRWWQKMGCGGERDFRGLRFR